MVELTLTFERKPIKTYSFDKEAILIGRDPTCDIQIDNVGVSRHHARVEKRIDVYILTDLASGNGTFVNGKKINHHNLNDGDEIGLWNYSLLFKIIGQPIKTSPAEIKGKDVSPSKMDLDMTISIDKNQLEAKQRERGSTIRGYLLYQEVKRNERTYSLLKTTTFWGKDPTCDFRLDGWFIMPKHNMIVRDENGFRFVNFAKHKRGTINKEPVSDHRLKDGDVIKIGKISYKYFTGLAPIK